MDEKGQPRGPRTLSRLWFHTMVEVRTNSKCAASRSVIQPPLCDRPLRLRMCHRAASSGPRGGAPQRPTEPWSARRSPPESVPELTASPRQIAMNRLNTIDVCPPCAAANIVCAASVRALPLLQPGPRGASPLAHAPQIQRLKRVAALLSGSLRGRGKSCRRGPLDRRGARLGECWDPPGPTRACLPSSCDYLLTGGGATPQSYEGSTGPDYWGTMEGYEVCKTGKKQSPINIVTGTGAGAAIVAPATEARPRPPAGNLRARAVCFPAPPQLRPRRSPVGGWAARPSAGGRGT